MRPLLPVPHSRQNDTCAGVTRRDPGSRAGQRAVADVAAGVDAAPQGQVVDSPHTLLSSSRPPETWGLALPPLFRRMTLLR